MKVMIDLDDALVARVAAQLDNFTFDKRVEHLLSAALDDADEGVTATAAPNVVEEVMKAAIARTKQLPPGTQYSNRDVFAPDLWANLDPGTRKKVGKDYRKEVEGATPPLAKYLHRNNSGHALYERLA